MGKGQGLGEGKEKQINGTSIERRQEKGVLEENLTILYVTNIHSCVLCPSVGV